MLKNLDEFEKHELLEEVKKMVAKELLAGTASEQDKRDFAAELIASFSAALAAAASKSGVWCKNINQNGVANNSNIYPEYEMSLEKNNGIIKSDLKAKPVKKTKLKEEDPDLKGLFDDLEF